MAILRKTLPLAAVQTHPQEGRCDLSQEALPSCLKISLLRWLELDKILRPTASTSCSKEQLIPHLDLTPSRAQALLDSSFSTSHKLTLHAHVCTRGSLRHLTSEDAHEVARLYCGAHAHSRILGMSILQAEYILRGIELQSIASARPLLSLAYPSPQGNLLGQIIGWEGKDIIEVQGKKVEIPAIVLFDYSVDPALSPRMQQLVGGRLLKGFIERYRHLYLGENPSPIPLIGRLRIDTSYSLITNPRHWKEIAKDSPVPFEIIEGKREWLGWYQLRSIIFQPHGGPYKRNEEPTLLEVRRVLPGTRSGRQIIDMQ